MKDLTPFYETIYNTLNNTWPMLTLFIIIVSVIKLARVIINHERFIFHKEVYNLLFIIYILLLYYLLLSTEGASSGWNLTPFKEITRYSITSINFFYNVIGNIVLFIPFGIFISDLLKAKKTYQIVFVSAIISLTAELIQIKIGRAFDIDDIILNVTGAIIGYLLYQGIKSLRRKLPSFLKNNIFYDIIAIIIIILMILLFSNIWGISLV